jgi:hypothetical protein
MSDRTAQNSTHYQYQFILNQTIRVVNPKCVFGPTFFVGCAQRMGKVGVTNYAKLAGCIPKGALKFQGRGAILIGEETLLLHESTGGHSL